MPHDVCCAALAPPSTRTRLQGVSAGLPSTTWQVRRPPPTLWLASPRLRRCAPDAAPWVACCRVPCSAPGAGSKSPLAQFVTAWVVGFVLLFLTPLFSNLPYNVLGAVVRPLGGWGPGALQEGRGREGMSHLPHNGRGAVTCSPLWQARGREGRRGGQGLHADRQGRAAGRGARQRWGLAHRPLCCYRCRVACAQVVASVTSLLEYEQAIYLFRVSHACCSRGEACPGRSVLGACGVCPP